MRADPSVPSPEDEARARAASPPVTEVEARALHLTLDAIDDAEGLVYGSIHLAERLLGRLTEMQSMAEEIAEEPGEIEDRELTLDKIELLAQQCDVIARKAVLQDVPALEGGRFAFPLPAEIPGVPPELVVEIPNLRSRGEGSLGLFEHVDSMVAVIGTGGRLLAGQEVDPEPVEPDPLDDFSIWPTEPLPEGEYQVELTYYSLDGIDTQLRVLDAEGQIVCQTRPIDLSTDVGGFELDLGNGLSLTIDRLPRSVEVEIESQTLQTLGWQRDAGERLDSVEGWLYRTVQPRDFELYALFLEGPRNTVSKTIDALEARGSELRAHRLAVVERLARGSDPSLEGLEPTGVAWSLFDSRELLNAVARGT